MIAQTRLTYTLLLLVVFVIISSCGTTEKRTTVYPAGVAYPAPQSTIRPRTAQLPTSAYPAPAQAAQAVPPFNAGQATKEAAEVAGLATTQAHIQAATPLPKETIPPPPQPATITPGPLPTVSSPLATPLVGGNGFLFDRPQPKVSMFLPQNGWVYTTQNRSYAVTAGDLGEPDGSHPTPQQGYITVDITTPDNRAGWPPQHIGGGSYATPSRDGPARIIDALVQGETLRLTIKTEHNVYDFDVLNGQFVLRP